MKKTPWLLWILLLLLFCSGCEDGALEPPLADPEVGPAAERLACAQLGELDGLITEAERQRVLLLLEQVIPLRQERTQAGVWEKSGEELRLTGQLNRLYERYTVKYLGSGGTWGYGAPTEKILAEYTIQEGARLRKDTRAETEESLYTEADFQSLWEKLYAFLPEGAWADFSRLIVFTDGLDETLAYVYRADSAGKKWVVAVDPADAADWDWFTETVLHEYAHYVTLNHEQVTYTDHQTAATYNEAGMVAQPDSYLDDFYQAFWADYLDDRLANMESFNFFLRHEPDFVTPYASTDPSEDIAESFAYFILYEPAQGDAVWEQKQNFFYQYPELEQFRTETRLRLGLD